MTRASQLHLWVGKTLKSQQDFDKYFDQTNAFMFDLDGREKSEEEIILSQFSIEIEKQASFDEDFLSIYYGGVNYNLDEALVEVQDSDDFEKMKKACEEKGVIEANAMFFYTDSELNISNDKKKYNDLTYIGKFNSPY